MNAGRLRPFTTFTLAAVALVAAGAASSPAEAFSFGKKKPVPVAPPPAPPPEPEIPIPTPALATFAVDAAAAYADYMNSASGISAHFANGSSITDAVRLGVHSEQHQLQQGEVAYAALVALQDPAFVAGVRKFANHASTRDAVVRNILSNPAYVDSLAGHDSAAGLVIAALNAQGKRLKSAGELVRQASYDIQLQSKWSKKPVPDQSELLEDTKTLSAAGRTPAADLRAQLQQVSTGAASLGVTAAPAAQPPYTETVTRGLAIAALAVLGMAGDDHIDYLTPLLTSDSDAFCFNMSKLNLYQCLSVARPYYEDIFCLGNHAMMDTGQCVMTSAGQPPPVAPLVPTTITTAGPAVAASVAQSAPAGPGGTPVETASAR